MLKIKVEDREEYSNCGSWDVDYHVHKGDGCTIERTFIRSIQIVQYDHELFETENGMKVCYKQTPPHLDSIYTGYGIEYDPPTRLNPDVVPNVRPVWKFDLYRVESFIEVEDFNALIDWMRSINDYQNKSFKLYFDKKGNIHFITIEV